MEIRQVDLMQDKDATAVLNLMQAYAKDPMGGGAALPEYTQENLISALKQQITYKAFIVWDNNKPIALANCFDGFSSFAAKPLINIHDFVVLDGYRGQGIGQRLMIHVCDFAKDKGYCKVTLEVLKGNVPAKTVYEKSGFKPYCLADDVAEFWQKSLT